jgi:hypothetical protein
MKLTIYFMLLSFAGFSGNHMSWTPYTFHVTNVKTDKTIEKGKAKIEFELQLPDNCSKGKKIQFKVDKGNKQTPVLDKNNKFNITVKTGKHVFNVYVQDCADAKSDTIYFDGQTVTFVTVFVQAIQAFTYKPVIYLYPEKTQEVNVQFNYNGKVDFTYPQYSTVGWSVVANADGTLEQNGKYYNYLFWDGKMNASLLNANTIEGSLVNSGELVSFLEKSLTEMGMNTKEVQDFITFWVPKMQENTWNYIHFLVNADYDRVSTLTVNPKPDNVLRVYMVWSPYADVRSEMPHPLPQEFKPVKRNGFTVVEWGGSEVNGLINVF